ncbi:MAG: hypothetical protein PHT80_13140 [Lentisphaeria bacterium]|nr:hypothetical protein [Lentisphaeria bacterium]
MTAKKMTIIRRSCMAVSLLSLIGLVLAVVGYFCQYHDLDRTKSLLLAVTVLWFATAPVWMRE